MKEIKKEITTEQVVYEITKEELEEIKRAERNRGREDVKKYIAFTLENYNYEFNVCGAFEYLDELIDFARYNNHISNLYNCSFEDWVRMRRSK